MFSRDDNGRDSGLFANCETVSEIIVIVNHLLGLDGVETLLMKAIPDVTREGLRQAADEIGRVGLKELAKLTRRYARKAKPAPLTFKTRWGR
jgi:hypothetical protein